MTTESNHTDESTPECPTCGKTFDTVQGMRSHHTQTHGESLVIEECVCDHCGDEFEPGHNTTGTYCTPECAVAARTDRVTLECEHCDELFEIRRARLDGRRFCSVECSGAASRLRKQQTCAQCTRPFRTVQSSDQRYCCVVCRQEADHDRPRPDDPEMLLWLLYVYEGWNLTETFRRQRAVLGYDNRLYKKEVRKRLVEMGVFERIHQHILHDNDGDVIGKTPAGDDSWQRFYGGEADD